MTITQTHPESLNDDQLANYLSRIEHPTTNIQPNHATLASITKAHLSSIPYENLDLHYQAPGGPQPVCSIRLPATYDKMVTRKRGGYCLEVNMLLAQALRAVGFSVDTTQARHVFDPALVHEPQHTSPRDLTNVWPTHLCLLVTVSDGKRHLVDVGLSKYSLGEPLPLLGSDDLSATVVRGILGKHFRLRATKDSPDASDEQAKGYYLQVSIPNAKGPAAERNWRDVLYFQDKPAGIEAEDFTHTWMSKGPHAVNPQCPFATMPVRGVGQVSIQEDELVIRKASSDSGDGYLFLEDGTTTAVTKQKLQGQQAVLEAMAEYFKIPSSYMESPRERVKVEQPTWDVDATGHPTIGYGHLCRDRGCSDVSFPKPLSNDDGKKILAQDLSTAQNCITLATANPVTLNANQYGALGENAKAVIESELLQWNKGNGKPIAGLTRRRKAEVALANTPTGEKALPVKC
ncbi:hypothetical protein NLG97_g8856 [Lecanicillium saksenae]|uniref:Uncharacterized protein n=1 Tax=Lecanicillium saksenae TaxID=468837 RepID=A0ACC1QLK5_9HYPO|nr:hypothetical protein NLG97_g8856 [Lecanicillium saksenae]